MSGEHRPHATDEIRANLRLMGFGAEGSSADSVAGKILNDDHLFAHADQNAFQQVSKWGATFTLGVLRGLHGPLVGV